MKANRDSKNTNKGQFVGDYKPNPGSDEAIEMGCICPVLDNCHGKGSMYGEGMFWTNTNCPIHGKDESVE